MACSSSQPNEAYFIDDGWLKIATKHPQVADFQCPITSQIMKDPVTAEDQFNYERAAIEAWLTLSKKSPQTMQDMGPKLVPNETLHAAIQKFKVWSAGGDSFELHWDTHGMWKHGTRSINFSANSAGPSEGSPSQGRDNRARKSMSQALSKFFMKLDPLRELLRLVLDGWAPPMVVVIGDESAGKSTLLEQLAMLPVFPRKRRFCTRSAIHLRLRRGPSSTTALSIYSVGNDFSHTLDGPPMMMPQENGWLWVQEQMDGLVKTLSSKSTHGVVKDKIIVLEVCRPDLPSIDLIDTPGLTAVPPEKADAVQALLARQLDEIAATGGHGIFVAVVPASGDQGPNVNTAMRYIQDNQLSEKTIGVFTKCDMVRHSDILRSLITEENTRDGESADDIGAVHLAKGWIATMLDPPEDEELKTHNFERLLIQQKGEAEFFSRNEDYRSLWNQGLAGTHALIERLEKEYSEYLNDTWKDGAMKKVLEKLAEKELELKMLGLVSGSEKDRLAKLEVDRRMGPNSPVVQPLYERFLTEKVNGGLVPVVKKHLEDLNAESLLWDPWGVSEELQRLQLVIDDCTLTLLRSMKPFFLGTLQDILTAESKIENEDKSLMANIFTVGRDCRLPMFRKGQPKTKIVNDIKKARFIQLCQYKQFTDKIVKKCEHIFDDAERILKEKVQMLAIRLTQSDSPWLKLVPHMMASPGSSIKVKPSVDTEGFLDALVVLIFSFTPAPDSLSRVHKGVVVGTETQAATEKCSQLMDDIAKIKEARDGIRNALDIGDAEFDVMQCRSEVMTDETDEGISLFQVGESCHRAAVLEDDVGAEAEVGPLQLEAEVSGISDVASDPQALHSVQRGARPAQHADAAEHNEDEPQNGSREMHSEESEDNEVSDKYESCHRGTVLEDEVGAEAEVASRQLEAEVSSEAYEGVDDVPAELCASDQGHSTPQASGLSKRQMKKRAKVDRMFPAV